MYLQSYKHVKSASYGRIQFKCFWIYKHHKSRIYKLGQAINSVDISIPTHALYSFYMSAIRSKFWLPDNEKILNRFAQYWLLVVLI